MTAVRRRVSGDGLQYHVVDTWTDKHGVTRCDVTVVHDVSWSKAHNLLPIIPGGRWDYAISHRPLASLLVMHRYVFIEAPPVKDWIGDLCPWVRP